MVVWQPMEESLEGGRSLVFLRPAGMICERRVWKAVSYSEIPRAAAVALVAGSHKTLRKMARTPMRPLDVLAVNLLWGLSAKTFSRDFRTEQGLFALSKLFKLLCKALGVSSPPTYLNLTWLYWASGPSIMHIRKISTTCAIFQLPRSSKCMIAHMNSTQ